MTRKEYERLYGSAPVLSNTSTIDTTPAPRIMTRAEYEKEFGRKLPPPSRGLAIKETFSSGLENIKSGFGKIFTRPQVDTQAVKESFAQSPLRGVAEVTAQGVKGGVGAVAGLGRIVGGLYQTALAPVLGPATLAGEAIGNKVGQALPTSVGSVSENIATNPTVMSNFQDILDISNLAVPSVASKASTLTKPLQVRAVETAIKLRNERTSRVVENELANIENNYQKLRKDQTFEADEGVASRKRIAQTDVLAGSVDTSGTLRTTQKGGAVEQYRRQTIDGQEGVVRDTLKRNGETVNLQQVERALTLAVDKSFEGADLIKALAGIKREIAGLQKRADEFGNIPLDKIHDAKISTTQNINYKVDSTPTISYRKAIASTYRQIVEDTSKAVVKVNGKEYTIKDINKELSKYYTDLERLASLDGRKVRGGRLGKYAAQLSGNLIGGAAGSLFGPVGAAVGGALGGEAAALLKGSAMSRTFGGDLGRLAKKNEILSAAKEQAKLPKTVDLRVPDVRVGAPKNIPKTKEISAIEGRIAKNVSAQKAAIAKGDFTLVATLKQVYVRLVEALKEAIKKAKTGTVRGFARIDLGQSKSDGKRNAQYSNATSKNKYATDGDTSTIPPELQPLAQEAKKYKTAEEFVKAQANQYHGTDVQFSEFSKDYLGKSTKAKSAEKGFWFTDNRDVAKGYGEYASEKKVRDILDEIKIEERKGNWDKANELTIKAEELSAEYTDPVIIESRLNLKNPMVYDAKGKGFIATDKKINDLIDNAQKSGNDALIIKNLRDSVYSSDIPVTHTIVFDDKNILTKSQLTDLWNKVHGGNKLDLADAVSKELANYDSTPLKVNGKIDLSNSDIEFRLDELKAIVEKKALTDAQVQEAADLLKKVGIDVLK